jgi:NAD(P)-dependent dehydrogenase (short-subunit alcohol dehydrogenase family)
MEMKGKIVVITGAGSGIGAATAKLFADRGAMVVVSDINLPAAEAVAKEIRSKKGTAKVIQTDTTHYDQVHHLISSTVETFGRIDVMVNNAGIGPKHMKKTADSTLEDWDNVIKVNQTGVFYGMKLALLHMKAQGHGNIVNVASLAGLKASGRNISYAASKFAVVGMTKAAALEYANSNIRINAVCPGYTESALLDRLISSHPDMETALKSVIPMRRFGKPEEIAEAVVWLASDATGFITGHTLTLDGGTSL